MKIYRSSDIEAVRARLKRKAEADTAVVTAVRAILRRSRGDRRRFVTPSNSTGLIERRQPARVKDE